MRDLSRRQLIGGLTVVAGLLAAGGVPDIARAQDVPLDAVTRDTLEAFADTVVPGEKRSAGDKVIAGAGAGPGAVQAGAVAVLTLPELPLTPLLPGLAAGVNTEATAYAAAHGVVPEPGLPPFVGLPFEHRTGLLRQMLAEGFVNKGWTLLAAIAALAFDTAAHLHTPEVAGEHPGLTYLRFPLPDADGLWRFPEFTYGRALAPLHPATTPSGSPA